MADFSDILNMYGTIFGQVWIFIVIIIVFFSFILYKYGVSFKDVLMYYYLSFGFLIYYYSIFSIPIIWVQMIIIFIFLVVGYYVNRLLNTRA